MPFNFSLPLLLALMGAAVLAFILGLMVSLTRSVRLQAELKAGAQKNTELLSANTQLQQQADKLAAENSALSAKLSELNTALRLKDELMQKQQELQVSTARELEERLNNLGERMLMQRAADLDKIGREQLRQTVGPLTEELKHFRDLIALSQKIGSEQAGALKTELLKLQQAQQSLTKQADALTRALTSGAKTQGLWGEHQLELCLDSAGLVLGRDYAREQVSRDSADGRGRPDVILFLPQKHCLIIDAKCSLTAYTRLQGAPDEQSRAAALKEHVLSVKAHIAELSAKRYDQYQGFNSPSFVFMFVPIDQALTAALQAAPELYQEAMLKSVYLVSPATLLPALKVTSNLWILATQNEKVRRIALEAQKIYRKLEGINEAFADVKRRHSMLQDSLSTLDARLCTGRGNLNVMLRNFAYKAPQELDGLDGEPELDPPAPAAAASAPEIAEQPQFEALSTRLPAGFRALPPQSSK